MPRCARIKSSTKIYHVINRGINKQDIFLDNQDFFKYIKELENTKEKYEYELLAYALMSDHVHFVIFDKNENFSTAIQSLNIRYTSYFNKKYERTGHLFENRFKSHTIGEEKYLKNVVRYIHKNPETAGLKPYIWTSYYEYISKPKLINPLQVLKCFNDNTTKAIKDFIEFHKIYNEKDDFGEDYELINRITDEEAIEIIKHLVHENNLIKIQNYPKEEKYKMIQKILKINGITKEQISRILGISRRTIIRIGKNY